MYATLSAVKAMQENLEYQYTHFTFVLVLVDCTYSKKLYETNTGRNVTSYPSTIYIHNVLNPLNFNISMHILPTVLRTIPMLLTRRISLAIKNSSVGDHILYSPDHNV